MTRHRWMGRFTRFLFLAVPGAALLQTTTSCGDVLRQTLLTSGVDVISTVATELLNSALTDILDADTATTS